ncbi:MAG: MoxR family ATPase [Candidatus Heimdallarchaeota archaeon]|nr:MoxR family ATPase [Candidatus Heimdallarchaeota archaeon]MDH5645370.1 MoxR family ATPase [Candidatus Heimdallarchaeota archaeon]
MSKAPNPPEGTKASSSTRSSQREKVTPKDIKSTWNECFTELKNVVIGKHEVLEDIMITLLAEGHILLEGVPGIAKTVITKAFADVIGMNFNRQQFTPDLLPSDVLGTNIFDPKTASFKLRRGPVFCNFLLADEINRSPPKTQAAMLECMAEKQVTIEGEQYALDPPFIVVATQNPVEQEGTYPLPEAQVDRFAMKLNLELPSADEEKEIIRLKHSGFKKKVRPMTTAAMVNKMIQTVKEDIYLSDELMGYIRDIIVMTRSDPRLMLGGSPRASLALLGSCKSYAALQGRNYVIPDDLKRIAVNSIAHRLQLKAEVELEGTTGKVVVEDIIKQVAVPI